MLEIDLNHVCACRFYTITHKRFWILSVMYMYAIQIINCINWIFSKCLYCVVMRYKQFFEHNLHFFLRDYLYRRIQIEYSITENQLDEIEHSH